MRESFRGNLSIQRPLTGCAATPLGKRTIRDGLHPAVWAVVAAFFLSWNGRAQFTVNGVTDKTVYNDSVSLIVQTQAGFNYSVTLNTNVIPAGIPVVVNQPDFYELRATRVDINTSVATNLYIRFIVAASERVDTEWGLPPHVPFPVIQSSSNEFAGAHFRLLAPASFPAGYPVPLVAWAVNDQDQAIRANGLLKNGGATLFQVRRGVGSGFISTTNLSGLLNLDLSLSALRTNIAVAIEPNGVWKTVSGVLSGSVSWPDNSRMQIAGGAIVPAGSSLTVGAGTIVIVNSGVTITNNGGITINGTVQNPVVFMGATASPWGGFVQHAANVSFSATGTIFTGCGAQPCWFNGHGCSGSISGIGSHRGEQALLSLNGANCNVSMTDCAAIYLAGQFGHSVSGGSYSIRLTRFLMQRTTSGGEFSSANFTVNDSAFIECPDDSMNFVDGDNDALYIVGGTHAFTNTLFGWTKDDGIDSGGTDSTSAPAKLDYQSCWFESTFHEGNSLSGYKDVFSRDSVYFDCGQGIEDGYNAPNGRVDHCFFSMCEAGIRHGDNYPSIGNYDGRFTATNCISIYNHRDLFGFNWHTGGGWTNSYDRFFVSNNWVSVLNTNYPNNRLWDPPNDGGRLASFGGVGHPGVGFATRGTALAPLTSGIPVGLSRFSTNEVRVDYAIDGTSGAHAGGTLVFPAGLTRAFLMAPTNVDVLRIALENPVNAEITGNGVLLLQNSPPGLGAPVAALLPLGASWRYLDNGSDQGSGWRGANFDDSAWKSSAGPLGFATDFTVATTLRKYVTGTSGPQITNYYFRRGFVVTNLADLTSLQFRYQRDDGCVVYLNGNEVFRTNIPPGAVNAGTFASSTISPNTESLKILTNTAPVSFLQAGTNILAVEVHQSTATSGDILWDLELNGLLSLPGARVNLARLGNAAVLYWSDPTLALEEADQVIGPWRLSGINSPAAASLISNRFFRLAK